LSAVYRKIISASYMWTNLTLMKHQDQAETLKATVSVKQPLAVEAVRYINNLGNVCMVLNVRHHPSLLFNSPKIIRFLSCKYPAILNILRSGRVALI
jgi:hypothetical protein